MFSGSIRTVEALQEIINVVPSPIFVKDRNHRWVLMNNAACNLIGLPRDALIGKSDYDIHPAEQARVFWEKDDIVFSTGQDVENEELHTGITGETRIIVTRKRLLHLNGGEPYLVAVITDVTAFREAEARNRYLAFHDALTGLPNRALFKDRLDQTLARVAGGSASCALLLLDLDGFKAVNDSYGHQVGDELLRAFADRLSEMVRPTDTVARLGGDEFAILAQDIAPDLVAELCRRVLDAVRQPFEVAGTDTSVGVSIGVVHSSHSKLSQTEFMRMGDVALYQAKGQGCGCYRVYTASMDESAKRRRLLETELRRALGAGEGLDVHYQPIFSTADGTIVGIEALARWRHRRLGMIPPAEFVPIAEEAGLAGSLFDQVLASACRTINLWPDLSVSVNLSATQLHDPNLVKRVLATAQRCGTAPERILLEVTETAVLETSQNLIETVQQLRAAGLGIALDDFGTGFSSLSHLRALKVDKIKIDRSFVQQLGASSDAGAIIEALSMLGRALGLEVTAEGVETEEQYQFVTSAECTEIQGFLLSRPLTSGQLVEFLKRTSLKTAALRREAS